jgi:glycosidase
MTVNPDHRLGWNVESQQDDSSSVLSFWRESLAFRKAFANIFIYGTFEMIPESVSHEKVVAYRRKDHQGDNEALVLLNFSDQDSLVPMPLIAPWAFLRGNYSNPPDQGDKIVLRPYEAVVYCKGIAF